MLNANTTPPREPLCADPRDDVCTLCLSKCSSKSASTTKYAVFHEMFQYMGLDIRQIFNVEREFPLGDDGEESSVKVDNVDIDVMMCKRCRGRMEVFHVIYTKYIAVKRKLDASVEGIHDVMSSAKGNYVETSREYLDVVAEGSAPQGEMEETSIPERFWRRPIAKGTLSLLWKSLTLPKEVTNLSTRDNVCSSHYADEFHEEQGASSGSEESPREGANKEEIDLAGLLSPDVHVSSKEESMSENEAQYSEKYPGDKLSRISGHGVELGDEWNTSTKGGVTLCPSSYSTHPNSSKQTLASKHQRVNNKTYECEVCGKVVASLKNFEVHKWIHSGEKPFECHYCQETFRDISGLRCHFLRRHRHYMFLKFRKPGVSLKQFQKGLDTLIKSALTRLRPYNQNRTTKNKKAEGCRLCKQYYKLRVAVEDHIVQRHYDVLGMGIEKLQEEMNTSEGLDRDRCLTNLKQIMAGGNTARMCGTCGERFKSAIALKSHVKTHIAVNRRQRKRTLGSLSCSSNLIKLKIKCRCRRYFKNLKEFNMHKSTSLANGGCSIKLKGNAS